MKRKEFDANEAIRSMMIVLGILLITTVLASVFSNLGIPETNIVVIYIMAVLFVARYTKGYFYGICSSVLAILCFNFFFTSPYYTLSVNDPSYIVTFGIMLITSSVTSASTTREKLMAHAAKEKEKESQMLYQLSSRLSDAVEMEDVCETMVENMEHILQTKVWCITESKQPPLFEKATHCTQIYEKEYKGYLFPLRKKEKTYAILCVSNLVDKNLLREKRELICSMQENAVLAFERMEESMERMKDRERMERERERANMLRAISHDLRTPLSGIMGTCEMLLDMSEKEDVRCSYIRGIYQDADWLKSLVENILSLTRLQDGRVVVQKEMEAMEEVIGAAVAHIEKQFPERSISVKSPEEFHLVPMDAGLMVQVITNLLNNAIKHTKKEEAIDVEFYYDRKNVIVRVKDQGTGIDSEDLPNIFQMFYTSKKHPVDVKKGIGLGLPICQTVLHAHGGTIVAKNREDSHGAEFIMTIPLKEERECRNLY